MWPSLILLTLLLGSQPAHAEDAAMHASLQAFFDRGVQQDGAKAELINVVNWPDAKGKLRWRMPHFSGHPEQLSLVAEQGEGAEMHRWYVPVRLHWWVKAVVAKNDVPPRTLLVVSMLKSARVDVAGRSGHWWKKPAKLAGARTTRSLRAGEVVYSSYVFRPPLLRRGDMITLIARIGGVRVSTVGKVLRPAGRGDRVQVRNMRSKQILQATVVNKNTAYVFVGGAG